MALFFENNSFVLTLSQSIYLVILNVVVNSYSSEIKYGLDKNYEN